MAKSLRQLMFDEIKDYGWLCHRYERGYNNAKRFKSYNNWLKSLDDKEFLATYKDVKECLDNYDLLLL